jgi:putative FmdB family regulatory protein
LQQFSPNFNMPTYEFRCPSGHDFEKFYRSIAGAPAVVQCPVCGKTAERQLSAGAGLVFKGSGFYITDYGKDGKKDQRAAPAAKDGSAPGNSESAAKSDSAAPPTSGSAEKATSEAKPAAASKPSETAAPKKAKDTE